MAGALAGLLRVAWCWARRRGELLRYRLTLVWLAVGGLAVLWLPTALRAVLWWPILAGVIVAAAWYFVAGLRARAVLPSTEPHRVAAVLFAVALAMGLPGQAAPPGSTVPSSTAAERGRAEGGPY